MSRSFGQMTRITTLALCLSGSAFAAAPRVGEALSPASIPSAPYDEAADAHAQVADAFARAAQDHKLVLLDFGGNWCPDCRVTAGVFALREVKPWIERNFEVVAIDVGRLTKNLDIAERYDVRVRAVPTIIVLTPEGRILNPGNPAALKDARSMTPQAIVDEINDWIDQSRG